LPPETAASFPPAGRRPGRGFAVALAGIGLVGLTGVSLLRSAGEGPAPVPAGSGELVIDGATYPFTARTCVITDGSVVAAGPGEVDGESYVVSVSSTGGAELTFGVTSDVDHAPEDHHWWVAKSLERVEVDESGFRAIARMSDRSGLDRFERRAVVDVSCPELS
jgi:hypothetical protein